MVREDTLRSITKIGSENLEKALEEKLQQIDTTLNHRLEEITKAVESFGDASSKIESIRTEVNQTVTQLEERLDRDLSSLDTRVNLLPILMSREDRITFRPEQQQPVLDCLHVLNEVEKLVLENYRNLTQGNRALAQKRTDARMQSRLAPLPLALQERIITLLEDFTYTTLDEQSKERMDRFWGCRDLRRAVLAYFASLPLAVQTTQASQPLQP